MRLDSETIESFLRNCSFLSDLNHLESKVFRRLVGQFNDAVSKFAFRQARELNLVAIGDDRALSHIDEVRELDFANASLTSDEPDEDVGLFEDLGLARPILNHHRVLFLRQDGTCAAICRHFDFFGQADEAELLGQ